MKPQKNFAPLCKRKIFTWYFAKRKKSRRNNKNFFTEIIKQDPKCFSCLWRIFFLRPWTKVPYFIFSTGKLIFYTFLGKIDWMNEKSVFFFFFAPWKKKKQLCYWMNEWHVNFGRKKKNQKNAKISEKKSNPFC